MIVGLTGGIGSGKTTVLNFFKEFESYEGLLPLLPPLIA